MHGTVRTPNLAQTFLVITHRRSLQDATRLIRDGFQRRALRAARGAGRSESTAIRDPSFYIRAGLVRLRRRAAQGRPLAHAMCLAQCPSGARSAPGARSGERRAPCDSRHEWLIRRDTEQRGRLVEGCSSNVEQAIGRRREEWAWGEGKALQLFVGCSGPGIDAPIVFVLRLSRSPLSPRTGFSSSSSTGRHSLCCPHNGTAPSTNTPPKTCASKFRRWSLRSLPPRRHPTLRRLPTLRGSGLTAHSARSIHPTPLPSFTHPTLVLSFIHPIPLLSIIRPILLPSIIRPILLPSIIHPIPAPSMGMHLTRRIPTYNRMPVYHSSCHNHHHRHRHNNTNKRSTSPTCITPSSSQKNRPIIQAGLYNY